LSGFSSTPSCLAYKRQQELDPRHAHQTTQITNITPSLDSYGFLFQSFSPERDFPANDLPPLAQDMVLNHTLDLQAKDKLFSLQDYLLLNYDMTSLCFQSLGIHPKYPFIHLFTFKPTALFPKELYFFMVFLSPVLYYYRVSHRFLSL
jgi:hypothetical protein